MTNLQQYTQRSEVGVIKPWGKATAPDGYVLCDGASLVRTGTYADLFAVISTTYGTADGTHFNVPDLQGKSPQGYDGGSSYDLADTGGANTVTVAVTNNQAVSSVTNTVTNNQAVSVTGSISNTSVSEAQLASHSHGLPGTNYNTGTSSARTSQGPENKFSVANTNAAGSGTGHTHAHTLSGTLTGNVAVTSSGGALSGSVTAAGNNTFSPYVVVNYIIRY